ncbi:phycocyanin alpha phycocyanobilin lyase related protein NblB [Pseudanabaena sp. lw0831]|uniref:HEAT repeat domain-containing protein n=1 Tax=Pseudanabaena sp. lw0831 TaxID=1357935 RepID=UPI0019155F37|nr:HEAT repeat domain-containing protein [Pseudanabaena sp. lw0831]GBO53201.1 phycocyanin alpha phycocyanobilin lyase related protein NblB [Pseudanabaena sp. lw0831]
MSFANQNPDLSNIARQLDSDNSRDRLRALVSLRDLTPDEAVPLILKVIDDENLQIRSMAVFALGLKHTEDCFPVLARILETEHDYGIRADAAGAMGYLQDNRAVEPLLRAFYEDTEWLVRFSAAVSLGNLGDVRAYDALIQALESEETMLHQAAIAALGEVGDLRCVDRILRFAQSDDWLTRQRLAEALGHLRCDKSLSALNYLVKDAHPQVSAAAQYAIDQFATN